MKATVNRIIEHSLIDGPGNRLVVFLQGCNLACNYCHNPETQRVCVDCGECVATCPAGALSLVDGRVVHDPGRCRSCDTCLKVCPHFSSPKYRLVDVNEVHARLLELQDFLDGVTVSGGECTLQHEFVAELFRRVKADTSLTTFIDTNGQMSQEALETLLPVTDGFMFDLKALDADKHTQLTGADNRVILENIARTSREGHLHEVRTVIVEGFTDDEAEITAIARLVKGLDGRTRLRLIPFRPNGVKTELARLPAFDRARYESLCLVAERELGGRVVRSR